MKTLIFLLVLVASLTGLDARAAVNTGGGINGSGGGTANFTNLTSAPGGQSLIKQNTGTNVVLYSLTNSGGITLSTNSNSIIIGLAIGTNDVTLATNSFAINTVQTNTTTNILFSANSLLLTPTATEGTKASLVVETAAGSGTFVTISQVGSPGEASFVVFTNSVFGFVPPGSRFYVTNQSIGSATAAVSIGYREYLLATTVGGGNGGNATNDIRLLVNGTNVTWPAYLTNSSTVAVTNVGGQVSFRTLGPGSGTVTGITNIGGGVSLINDSNAPIFIMKSLTNSTAGISFTDNLTNIGATLSANLLLWNSVTTNMFTDTNRFELATNGIIGMFTTFTNTAVDTNTYRLGTNLLTDTNMFRLATNGIIGMFTTYTNQATDTNIFRQATNGIIGMFTTFTNVAITTNTFWKQPRPVAVGAYDAVEPTVILIDGNVAPVWRVTVTKATTLRWTNWWDAALTNSSRPCGTVYIRQDASGTWAVGTQLTNALAAFGAGGTNLNVRTNATSISTVSFESMPFTNSMIQASWVTNSVP